MYCGKCGASISNEATCPICGTPTGVLGNAAQGAQNTPPQVATGPQAARQGIPRSPQRQGSQSRGTKLLDSLEPQYVGQGMVLSVFEGSELISEISLPNVPHVELSFGSSPENNIVINSSAGIVSRRHGSLIVSNGQCVIIDRGSTNGLYVNGVRVSSSPIGPGDTITIGDPRSDSYEAIVLMVRYDDHRWREKDISGLSKVSIGRLSDNDLVINSPSVSAHHAFLSRLSDNTWTIMDNNSYNGTYLNGVPVVGSEILKSGDVILVANTTLLFMDDKLLCAAEIKGVELIAEDLVQVRKNKRTKIVTNDHISLHIGKGEFVAIVGGSGSGKTTLLNELNGSEPASSGVVTVDGIDLYANYGRLKNSIGYVPQQDIVYDNLRLIDMLKYAAELRMPPDTTKAEREARAHEVLEMLELGHVENNFIGRLSGGQKKRASIAVELLADPRLLFLDEPTSGLDPGIEQSLMRKLSSMAHGGRTIILVTHTTLNLDLCDQVIFLAPGGKLCYAGDPHGALEFFGIDDYVEAYSKVSSNPAGWEQGFARKRGNPPRATSQRGKAPVKSKKNPSFIQQLSTLSRRYFKLLINDVQRLALLILQAPILAALICMVAGEDCFSVYEDTKSCLFALSCAAFWVGMLDSIQEICKERVILKREYAGGLNLIAYIFSKVFVLGILCIVQSALLSGVFCIMEGAPEESLINATFELFVTVFLTTFSAMCLGLLVSALFRNPDRAIAMAPILIMPQILFSGLIFKLEGFAENISAIVNCRWGMEAFGTTANLNALDLSIYENDLIDSTIYEHEWESAFEYTIGHLVYTWDILGVFCIVCLVGCVIALKISLKK